MRITSILMLTGGLSLLRSDPATQQHLLGAFAFSEEPGTLSKFACWPILGSMFMFRTMVYLYDQAHMTEKPTWLQSLSYFFMLPNVCFPLYPVVDFKRFQRNYYDVDAGELYSRGASWIARGVLHLVAYRFVYDSMAIPPSAVDDAGSMLRFSVSAFLLYAQVSGNFHLIVGMLLLFGFNLPLTNDRHFLASSFTDFWRRINLYWKDFMLKVFFHPAYFKLKKLGAIPALVLSTLFVFFLTWALHAYQWFWLHGSLLLAWNDVLFWVVLGVLMTVNLLYEAKYGRERSLGTTRTSASAKAATLLARLGTFATMTTLWSMWSADSLTQWMDMWRLTGGAWWWPLLGIPALFALSLACRHVSRGKPSPAPGRAGHALRARASRDDAAWRSAALSGSALCALWLLAAARDHLPESLAQPIERVAQADLNRRDATLLQLGYYEDLISVNRHNTQLWSMYWNRPADWGQWGWPTMSMETGDMLESVLAPSARSMLKGATVTTNRWGMRDKEYALEKPAGTFRIALLGASYAFGAGVENEELFEAVLERRLNREPVGGHRSFEVLNFARRGKSALASVMILEQDALRFEPDAVMLISHHTDHERLVANVARLIHNGVAIPYPEVQAMLARIGASSDLPRVVIEGRLRSIQEELQSWCYRRLVETCRQRRIQAWNVLLSLTQEHLTRAEVERNVELATAAGFEVIDLSRVYEGRKRSALTIAPWDNHPNREAHEIIADALHDALRTRQLRE